jgi:hypothetical protein
MGSQVRADEKFDIKIGKIGNGPAFTISGGRYQLINNVTHMHFCVSSWCEPGSKVSYVVTPPNKDYSFKQYQREREMIAGVVRKMAPAGTRIDFAEPEKVENELFRILKAKREQVASDGKTTVLLSPACHGRWWRGLE